MPTHTDLEIIILNYNTEFWLKKCLTSLKQHYLDHTKYVVKVTVVDNNSQDNSVLMIKTEYPWVHLIQLSENKGFASGNNQALKSSTARYVLLLNSDVELTSESRFDELIEYMNKHPQVGIITPRVEFSNGALDPASHRGEPTLWASFTYFIGLAHLFPKSTICAQYHQTYKDFNTIHSIDACSGASMMVRAIHMQEVGLLDERFFMYAEDLDWCHRFRLAHKDIIFYPLIKVIHHKYKSGIKHASQKIAKKTKGYFYDTMLQYFDKYYAQSYPPVVRTVVKYILLIKKGA